MEQAVRTRDLAGDEGLPLPLGDLVITGMATLAAAYLAIAGRWAAGAPRAIVTFSIIAIGPPVLRALARKFPGARVVDMVGSFWLLPAVAFGHCNLSPLVDAVHPRLLDAWLSMADLRLFGFHPSVFLERHAGPALTEAVMLCYYTYFLWPVVVGALLYFKRERRLFDEYILALALFFAANFVLYLVIPAIGPRFFLAGEFQRPLQGLFFTPFLDSLMRSAPFNRDCFPSGHTGITLVMLTYAYRYHRRFFWGILPVATGLILATLIGRFHYGVDLLAAVPLTAAAVSAAGALSRASPRGVVMGTSFSALRESEAG